MDRSAKIAIGLFVIIVAGIFSAINIVSRLHFEKKPDAISDTGSVQVVQIEKGSKDPAVLQTVSFNGAEVSLVTTDQSAVDKILHFNDSNPEPIAEGWSCNFPALYDVKANASLEYRGQLIPLGYISIPAKVKGGWPVVENSINEGLGSVSKTLEWSPLYKTTNGVAVVDYTSLDFLDARKVVNIDKAPNVEGCYVGGYRILYFEEENGVLELKDTIEGADLYTDIERIKEQDVPLGCTPSGCG